MDRERIEHLVELSADDHDARNTLDKLDIRQGGDLPKFKVRDLVRITKDPPNQGYMSLKGLTGFITDDQGEYDKYGRMYFYQELNAEYSPGCGGGGSVPEDCLEHFSPDSLKALKKQYDVAMKKRWEGFQFHQEHHKPGSSGDFIDPYDEYYDD